VPSVPATHISIAVSETVRVSGLLQNPTRARACYVLAHGAGAGMDHPFLVTAAAELALRGIASLRYQFPYMEHRAKRPDSPQLAQATARAAAATARDLVPELPLIAGGKSLLSTRGDGGIHEERQLCLQAVGYGSRRPQCPLWVKNGHDGFNLGCPLYPRKRTLIDGVALTTSDDTRVSTCLTLSMLERVLRCLKPTLVARHLENLLRGGHDFTWGNIPAVSAAVNAQRPTRELDR
jgi:hypothetical protein